MIPQWPHHFAEIAQLSKRHPCRGYPKKAPKKKKHAVEDIKKGSFGVHTNIRGTLGTTRNYLVTSVFFFPKWKAAHGWRYQDSNCLNLMIFQLDSWHLRNLWFRGPAGFKSWLFEDGSYQDLTPSFPWQTQGFVTQHVPPGKSNIAMGTSTICRCMSFEEVGGCS